MTAKPFGLLPDGRPVHLYKIRLGSLEAEITALALPWYH